MPAIIAAVEKVFRAQEMESDVLSTWLLLREAVERNRLHGALVKEVAARLERMRDRPAR